MPAPEALLAEHFGYLSDAVKLRRYGAAVAAVVKSDHLVLDLGCGSGVLGLACLRAGARQVHFVDNSPFIEVARRAVVEAGYASRSSFHRALAQHVELTDRVDVVICDHVGHFGLDYGLIEVLLDARARFLKPDGIIIPAELHLTIAGVESANCRARVGNWRGEKVPADYQWVGDLAADAKHAVQLQAGDLLTEASQIAVLRPGIEAQPFFSWTVDLVARRDGTLDGIGGWFDCRLAADVWMTNSPLADERLNRPQAFFPLSTPVPVTARSPIRATVMARPADHLLAWSLELPATGQRFAQSTWNGLLIDETDLVRADPARTAVLNHRGRARRIVLGYCDGVRSVAEVERMVLRDYPDLFASPAESARFVTHVLAADTGS